MIGTLVPLLVAAALAAASPLGQDMVTKQALRKASSGWEFKASAPADLTLNMQISLKEQNMDKLQQRLLEMSNPEHADYGKHMSKADIEALTAPSAAHVGAVRKWLESHGVRAGDVVSGTLAVTMSATQAEELLGAKYGVYYHAQKGVYTVRTTQYSLPRDVHDAIAMVQPTTLFSDMNMSNGRTRVTALSSRVASGGVADGADKAVSCDQGLTPPCLRDLYKIEGYTPQANKTTIGITGYLHEVAGKADLQSFLQQYTKIPSDATFGVHLINGGTNDGNGTGEANLDTQYAMGLTYPIHNDFYSTAGSPPFIPDASTPNNTNEPYIEWLNYMNGLDKVPTTVTSSYGDNEQTVPRDYAETVCNQFMKLAARGVSVLVSSGDGGVAGGQTSKCVSNDGKCTRKFLPTFPASCPLGVTAVGGTTKSNPEVAAGLSSGGFSDYFPVPDYQSAQTKAYISGLGDKYAGLYNRGGRGIPDVAAQAERFVVVIGGKSHLLAGTSCSSPTFASVVALLNDYRVAEGRAPLGFLNPWLYSKGHAGLNDITQGTNPGCDTEGFSAGKGWDPVTGLGTPNFVELKKLV
ncbi:Tripeptidyl-peptidase I [Purpureocillium takamizusanense]|uniref:tripeptidyl-peptidase II n=1 Tax=Purpureocillium takamizusanense TaxID=2060973 RepID=A0A9Q8VC76_9HYPO|nr:Tripeptidyl-peptidase I [Purpureocillium takamizusanense]UNI19609.1 Tripeptidyl-peptidase I [Purpureocillium takamizusanense]